jgi:hypothetical protein
MCSEEQHHDPDPHIDRIWADEGERRFDAYLRGEATSREARDVLAKYLNRDQSGLPRVSP